MTKPSPSPPTVAVIGCGPGGMFFLHALATRRRELESRGDAEGVAALPVVACFERASEPGGVWRAKREFSVPAEMAAGTTSSGAEKAAQDIRENTTNMYEALWTNGPKEAIEFFDYTFDDHFGRPLPIYMPRQPLLEYMMCRVTQHQPTFFEDYVTFNTEVSSVAYDDSISKFVVVTKNVLTQDVSTSNYDKCIWSAGECGVPYTPSMTAALLRQGKFAGKCMHSSNMEDFDANVAGKRVLLIGDAYSAEDLALTSIKRGVDHVYICSRNGEGAASFTCAWPMNKVTVYKGAGPSEVINDGRGIRLHQLEYNFVDGTYEGVPGGEISDLEQVDTVIYCTGYAPNMQMLDESLQPTDADTAVEMPPDWRMKPNVMTETLGDVEASGVYPGYGVLVMGVYRGMLISNPSMMFVTNVSETPLLEIDIMAWLLLANITGTAEIPTEEEMHRRNRQYTIEAMDDVYTRTHIDDNYSMKWTELCGETHWVRDGDDPRFEELEAAYHDLLLRGLARDARTAGYPNDMGSWEGLNERGREIVAMNMRSVFHRFDLDPNNKEESSWRTFRDCYDSGMNRSLFTGTAAVPLKKRWLELDDDDDDVIAYEMPSRGEHGVEIPLRPSTKDQLRGSDDLSNITPPTETASDSSVTALVE